MTIKDFIQSLKDNEPPKDLPLLVVALWHDKKGNWERAHQIVQDDESQDAAWIHAYLHRKEGDIGNAGYWYRRAKKKVAEGSLDEEWEEIIYTLLSR